MIGKFEEELREVKECLEKHQETILSELRDSDELTHVYKLMMFYCDILYYSGLSKNRILTRKEKVKLNPILHECYLNAVGDYLSCSGIKYGDRYEIAWKFNEIRESFIDKFTSGCDRLLFNSILQLVNISDKFDLYDKRGKLKHTSFLTALKYTITNNMLDFIIKEYSNNFQNLNV